MAQVLASLEAFGAQLVAGGKGKGKTAAGHDKLAQLFTHTLAAHKARTPNGLPDPGLATTETAATSPGLIGRGALIEGAENAEPGRTVPEIGPEDAKSGARIADGGALSITSSVNPAVSSPADPASSEPLARVLTGIPIVTTPTSGTAKAGSETDEAVATMTSPEVEAAGAIDLARKSVEEAYTPAGRQGDAREVATPGGAPAKAPDLAKTAEAGQDLPVAGARQGAAAAPAQTAATTTAAVAPGAVQPAGADVGAPSPASSQSVAQLAATVEPGLARSFEQVSRPSDARLHLAVDTPVRAANFATEFGEKVTWLAGRQGQWASLSLTPPQLGAVEVRLTVSNGEVGAQFFSASPAVREAIEAALPRLRELMADAGLSLGESHVREEAFSRREGANASAGNGEADTLATTTDGGATTMDSLLARRGGHGLVDLYV